MALFKFSKHVRENVPSGSHVARCVTLADMGTSLTGKFGPKKNIMLVFEVPSELAKLGDRRGQPLTIRRSYSATLGKKSGLKAALESWTSKKFETDEEIAVLANNMHILVGRPAIISVKEEGEYTNLDTISGTPAGVTCPAASVEPLYFIMNLKLWDPTPAQVQAMAASRDPDDRAAYAILQKRGSMKAVYAKLPEWIRDEIAKSPEFKAISTGRDPDAATGEEIQPDAVENFPGEEEFGAVPAAAATAPPAPAWPTAAPQAAQQHYAPPPPQVRQQPPAPPAPPAGFIPPPDAPF